MDEDEDIIEQQPTPPAPLEVSPKREVAPAQAKAEASQSDPMDSFLDAGMAAVEAQGDALPHPADDGTLYAQPPLDAPQGDSEDQQKDLDKHLDEKKEKLEKLEYRPPAPEPPKKIFMGGAAVAKPVDQAQLGEHLDRALGAAERMPPPNPPRQADGWKTADSWDRPKQAFQAGAADAPGNAEQFPGIDPNEMRAAAEAEFRDSDRQRWDVLVDHLDEMTEVASEHAMRIEAQQRFLERYRL